MENKIRELRESRGMSLELLSKKIGVCRTALNQIELGNRKLSFIEACKICDALKYSIENLKLNYNGK